MSHRSHKCVLGPTEIQGGWESFKLRVFHEALLQWQQSLRLWLGLEGPVANSHGGHIRTGNSRSHSAPYVPFHKAVWGPNSMTASLSRSGGERFLEPYLRVRQFHFHYILLVTEVKSTGTCGKGLYRSRTLLGGWILWDHQYSSLTLGKHHSQGPFCLCLGWINITLNTSHPSSSFPFQYKFHATAWSILGNHSSDEFIITALPTEVL